MDKAYEISIKGFGGCKTFYISLTEAEHETVSKIARLSQTVVLEGGLHLRVEPIEAEGEE